MSNPTKFSTMGNAESLMALTIFQSSLRNNFRALFRNRMFLTTTILFPWVASSVLQIATIGNGGNDDRYFFFCLIFSFWFLLNVGVRQIVDERAVIMREFFAGLPPILYLAAKQIFLIVIGFYIAIVLAISVHVNWVDWQSLSLLVSKPFLSMELPSDFPEVVVNNSPEQRELERVEQLNDAFQRIKGKDIWGFVLVDRNRLVPSNPFACLWVRSPENGWGCRDASSLQAKIDWFEAADREQMTLPARFVEQFLIITSLDYSFLILLLGGISGAALGLLISATASSTEGAFQLVPYLTIFQILMSREIIKAGTGDLGEFALLSNFSFQDIMTWGFGSKLSLMAVCRYLQTVGDNTVLIGISETTFGVLDLLASGELAFITGWNVIILGVCWMALRHRLSYQR